MNKVIIIKITNSVDISCYNKFHKIICPQKLSKINTINLDLSKKHLLISEILIRYLACKHLKCQNDFLKFGKNSFGKPFIKTSDNFHYNISHSGKIVCCYVSSKSKVGIDVEEIIYNKRCNEKFIKRLYSAEEQSYLASDSKKKEDRFFEIWTKKEAFIKWLGSGLSLSMGNINTIDKRFEKIIKTFKLNNYFISVCNSGKYPKIAVFSEEDFLQLSGKLLLAKQ